MMSVADVIDVYGYLMNEKQLKSLERIHPAANAKYLINGQQNDGSYYDATRSHEWNTQKPGLAYRQLLANRDIRTNYGGDVVAQILQEGDDIRHWGDENMMRVTTVYWKTQRRVGHLTRITEDGDLIQEIVDDKYKLT